jgi:hypothetical protein
VTLLASTTIGLTKPNLRMLSAIAWICRFEWVRALRGFLRRLESLRCSIETSRSRQAAFDTAFGVRSDLGMMPPPNSGAH